MCMDILPACLSVNHESVWYPRRLEEAPHPLNPRSLWAILWVLGIDPRSPRRAASHLNCGAISPLLALPFLIVWLVGNCFVSVLDSSHVCRNTVLLLTGLLVEHGSWCLYVLSGLCCRVGFNISWRMSSWRVFHIHWISRNCFQYSQRNKLFLLLSWLL